MVTEFVITDTTSCNVFPKTIQAYSKLGSLGTNHGIRSYLQSTTSISNTIAALFILKIKDVSVLLEYFQFFL